MTAVTFPNGHSYSDDGTTANDMRNGGHRTNLLPMIGDAIDVAADAVTAAETVADRLVATSTSTVTVGSGTKTFTISATGKSFAVGSYVMAYKTSDPTIYVVGKVSTFSDPTLTLSVGAADFGGSGSVSAWTIVLSAAPINGDARYVRSAGGDGSAVTAKSVSGTTYLPLAAWFDFVVRPEAFGAVADASTDNQAAIQAAFDAAAAAGPGAIVEFGPGCFVTDGPLYVRKGMVIRGSGRGALPTSNGGTTLRASYGDGDIISIQSDGGVTIRDMCIDAAGQTLTAGAAIRVAGLGSAAESQNRPSAFECLYIKEVWDGIVIKDAQNYHISGNWFLNYKNIGIDINPVLGTGDTADTNGGQAHIIGNTIHDHTTTGEANIRYCNGGDVRVIGNKLIGGKRGLWVSMTAGPTGTMLVEGNSIEQHSVYGVAAEQAVANSGFGNLIVAGNQFLSIDTDLLAEIYVGTGTLSGDWVPRWLNTVVIANNAIGMALPVGSSARGIKVLDGAGVSITDNVIHALDRSGPKGIQIGSDVQTVQLSGNVGLLIPSGLYDTMPSGVSVQDVDTSSGAWRTFRQGSGLFAKMDDLASGVEIVAGSDGTDAYFGANNSGSMLRLLAQAVTVLRLQTGGGGDRFVYMKSAATGANVKIGSNGPSIEFEGINLLPASDNSATLGDASHRFAAIWGATGTVSSSDARLKTEDASLDGAKCWDFLSRLRPLTFRWIVGGRTPEWDDAADEGRGAWTYTERPGLRRHAGFFAQEVSVALEASGLEITGLWVEDQTTGEQGLRHDQLMPYIVAGLMWRDARQTERMDAIEARLAAIEAA